MTSSPPPPAPDGPCEPWPVDTACCDGIDDIDPAQWERWRMVATRILWALSGRRFGPSCPITVRPCRRSCTESLTPSGIGYGVVGPWVPYIGVDGLWRNASVCGCRSDCSCTELCEVQLQGPVYDVLSVMIDGAELVPEAYRVDEPGLLVRTDDGCWPDCQDMAAACDAEGTFCVTYRTGLPLDEAAVAAVSEYACHLAKGCGTAGGSCGCRPNPNLTRIQRQGVEIERADPSVVYAEGRVGLPLVDQWLVAVNPGRLGSASRAYSVDWRWPRRTRWP